MPIPRLTTKACAVCGAAIRRRASEFRSAEPTCSVRCRDERQRRRAAAARPAARERRRDGYVVVFVGHEHHLADARGYAPRARVVAEAKLGRPLEEHERAVHVNGDSTDDRPENIVVVRCARR